MAKRASDASEYLLEFQWQLPAGIEPGDLVRSMLRNVLGGFRTPWLLSREAGRLCAMCNYSVAFLNRRM